MLELQDKFNHQVNPDWRSAGYRWTDAIMVESVELLEHFGWKWWKKQTPDMEQCRMELIDIWHFVMSHEMQSSNQEFDTNRLVEYFMGIFEMCTYIPIVPPNSENIKNRIRYMIAAASDGQFERAHLINFISLLRDFGIDDDLLFKMYIGKNALNKFRQDNGYKDGTYIKIWNGKEDNEVLTDILNTLDFGVPENAFNEVYNLLKANYVNALTWSSVI